MGVLCTWLEKSPSSPILTILKIIQLLLVMGSINTSEIPEVKYVFFVDGLKENLISIREIFDDNYLTKFTYNTTKTHTYSLSF